MILIKNENRENALFAVCECSNMEHTMRISSFIDKDDKIEDELYIHFTLNNGSFWYRLKNGIKYIFGYKSKYGMFDEIIVNREEFLKNIKFI